MCPLWQQVINEGNSPSLQFIIMTKKSVYIAINVADIRIIAWQPLPLQFSTYSYDLDTIILSHDHSVYKLTSAQFDNRTIIVKTFGLLQPYFGHLSCMPVVYVTHYKTSKECFLFFFLSVVEKLLSQLESSNRKAYRYTRLHSWPFYHNQ